MDPITTIDTHTAGGPTRIILSGLPPIAGTTAAERMADFKSRHDGIRKFLLNEPRGHRGMYGAVLGPPPTSEVDRSVFFMTTGGYLPTCVHGSIGVATALLTDGSLTPRPDGRVYFDTPGGVVPLMPRYRDGRLAEIALRTPPGRVLDPAMSIALDGRRIAAAAVFCGVPFLVVAAEQWDRAATIDNLRFFVELAPRLLEAAGPNFVLALFHDRAAGGGRGELRDVVIGRTGGIDRSPCGAGVGALAIQEHQAGRLGEGERLSVTGVIGTRFTGAAVERDSRGITAEITGGAWVTGTHQFRLGDDDPLPEGFELGV